MLRNCRLTVAISIVLLVGIIYTQPAAEDLPMGSAAASQKVTEDSDREFPGSVHLLLPKVIYAVPGIEMNVYFDNVVLVVNPANYVFDVTCPKGIQQSERWTYTPSAKDVGEYPFKIEIRNERNAIIARAKATLHVAPANTGANVPVTLLCIGDSLTHASIYTQHLLDLCKLPGNPKLKLIGTHSPKGVSSGNRHEGYGGWTAQRFATHYTGTARTGNYRKRGSPFIYKYPDGKPRLNFTRYCEETNQGKGPDFVTILLGCNDTFSATDETIEERIDVMFKYYDILLQMIHSVSKDTQIGAMLLVPPAATQDAFGANYKCAQTRWQYKRNQHRVVERMMEHYGNLEKENIWLIPTNVNLDCVHNYPQHATNWNARTSQKGSRLNNGVHPSAEGYRQIGDSIYCWMKARLAK